MYFDCVSHNEPILESTTGRNRSRQVLEAGKQVVREPLPTVVPAVRAGIAQEFGFAGDFATERNTGCISEEVKFAVDSSQQRDRVPLVQHAKARGRAFRRGQRRARKLGSETEPALHSLH